MLPPSNSEMKCKSKISVAIAAVFLVLFCLFLAPVERRADAAQAENTDYGDFRIANYRVEMNLLPDRSAEVREVIECEFSSSKYDLHGIIRDFPLDSGEKYLHIKAECDDPDFSPYTKSDSSAYLSLYLRGRGRVTGERRTYTITYTVLFPKTREVGYLPIDLLGSGWQATVGTFSSSVTFPEGLETYEIYSGSFGLQQNAFGAVATREGNTIFVTAEHLNANTAVTLDLKFGSGVLGGRFDLSLLLSIVFGVAAVLCCLLVKFLFCRQPLMTRTVNLTAPEEMDPLLMGKLIDNVVDSEDLGALVFYLADKGYLTIDLSEDEDDPVLHVTGKSVSGEPTHVRMIFDGLFERRETVRMEDLEDKFYKTAQSAIAAADLKAGNTYSDKSKKFMVLMGAIAVLLLGGFAFFYNFVLSFRFRYYAAAIAALAAFAISAVGNAKATQRKFKWSKFARIMTSLGAVLLSLLACFVTQFLSPALSSASLVAIVVFSSFSGVVAGNSLTRTEEYSARLGHILGFKEFITVTEKDKIQIMLSENPDLYYHVLPYAQVLGVTDEWTDKFKGLSLAPPSYCYGASFDLFDAIVFTHMFHHLSSGMGQTFVSRPSSSGGGSHGGGFGGGFSGGGFGGGGGRSC